MKHIKSVNEFYHRTAGFKYSKPTIRFSVTCYYIASGDDLSSSIVKAVSKYLNVESENISLDDEVDIVTIPGAVNPDGTTSEEPEQIDVDGMLKFDILIYNEREVEKIMDDITKELYVDYDVRLVDVAIKEQSKIK